MKTKKVGNLPFKILLVNIFCSGLQIPEPNGHNLNLLRLILSFSYESEP